MAEPVEALVLMHECFTPCSANIAWRAKIRGEGHPLRIKFPGVAEWFESPGEGNVQAPAGIETGETFFVSSDQTQPHVRVQVYKKIILPGGGSGPPAPVADPIEALVLMHECFTPCSANMAWRFQIVTNGRPIQIKFQGVQDWFTYAGEGQSQAPTQWRSGETQFVSQDETHPNVLVQVYKIITVERGAAIRIKWRTDQRM